jgi:hypothetical protein
MSYKTRSYVVCGSSFLLAMITATIFHLQTNPSESFAVWIGMLVGTFLFLPLMTSIIAIQRSKRWKGIWD